MTKPNKQIKKQAAKKAIKKTKISAKQGTAASSDLFYIAGVILLTAIVFFPSLSYDFVNWDDDVNITENPNLVTFTWENIKGIFSSTVIGNYNPLTILTFAIEKHLFGLKPAIFHFNNWWLHLGCTFFVFKICRELGLKQWSAVAATLIFSLHPMRVESVTWITERKDVLFGIFYFSAIYLYIRNLKKNDLKMGFSLGVFILFILALFSKIQAVSLPLSLILIDYLLIKEFKLNQLISKWPYFVGALCFGILGIYFLGEAESLDDGATFGFIDRIFIGAYSFVVYMVKFIFPYSLSAVYPYPKAIDSFFYLAMIPCLAYAYWMYWCWKNEKHVLLFSLGFFLANIVFVLQILGAGQGFLADRFTYVAHVGWAFGLCYYIQKYYEIKPKFKISLLGLPALLIVSFAFKNVERQPVWNNGYDLWTSVIESDSNTTLPFGNRAFWLSENKRFEEALIDYDKAIALNPQKASYWNSRGKVKFDLGRVGEAMVDYNRAISLEKNKAEFFTNRASAFGFQQKFDLSLKDLNEAERLDPNFKYTYFTRSLLYTQTNQYQLALNDNLKYISLDPTNPDIWIEAGMHRRLLGQYPEALKSMDQAISMNSNNGLYYLERARLYRAMNNPRLSRRDAERAVQLGAQVDENLLQ